MSKTIAPTSSWSGTVSLPEPTDKLTTESINSAIRSIATRTEELKTDKVFGARVYTEVDGAQAATELSFPGAELGDSSGKTVVTPPYAPVGFHGERGLNGQTGSSRGPQGIPGTPGVGSQGPQGEQGPPGHQGDPVIDTIIVNGVVCPQRQKLVIMGTGVSTKYTTIAGITYGGPPFDLWGASYESGFTLGHGVFGVGVWDYAYDWLPEINLDQEWIPITGPAEMEFSLGTAGFVPIPNYSPHVLPNLSELMRENGIPFIQLVRSQGGGQYAFHGRNWTIYNANKGYVDYAFDYNQNIKNVFSITYAIDFLKNPPYWFHTEETLAPTVWNIAANTSGVFTPTTRTCIWMRASLLTMFHPMQVFTCNNPWNYAYTSKGNTVSLLENKIRIQIQQWLGNGECWSIEYGPDPSIFSFMYKCYLVEDGHYVDLVHTFKGVSHTLTVRLLEHWQTGASSLYSTCTIILNGPLAVEAQLQSVAQLPNESSYADLDYSFPVFTGSTSPITDNLMQFSFAQTYGSSNYFNRNGKIIPMFANNPIKSPTFSYQPM